MYEGNEPSPSRLRITYYHSVLSMQAWSPLGNPSLSTAINVDVELLAEILVIIGLGIKRNMQEEELAPLRGVC